MSSLVGLLRSCSTVKYYHLFSKHLGLLSSKDSRRQLISIEGFKNTHACPLLTKFQSCVNNLGLSQMIIYRFSQWTIFVFVFFVALSSNLRSLFLLTNHAGVTNCQNIPLELWQNLTKMNLYICSLTQCLLVWTFSAVIELYTTFALRWYFDGKIYNIWLGYSNDHCGRRPEGKTFTELMCFESPGLKNWNLLIKI